MMTRILHTLTNTSTSRWGKFCIIGAWLIFAIGLKTMAPNLTKLYNNTANQSIPAAADSQVAQRLLLNAFPNSRGVPAILVFSDPAGLSIDDRIRIHQVSDWLSSDKKPAAIDKVLSVFTVPQATGQLLSADGTTMTLVTTLKGSSPTDQSLSNDQSNSIRSIRQYLQNITGHASLQAYVTGPAGIVTDLLAAFTSVDVKVLLTTIGLVFVLLIVLYRSPILALLPLFAIGITNMAITGLLGFFARAGLPVAQMSTSIATVLLFGAGTDYNIFIVSRFREELERTPDKHLAMQRTMHAVGEAITSSAGTVILAMAALLLATLGLYSALGPTLALTIFIMLLAGLTLVPALIVWLGRAAYWPFVPLYRPTFATSSVSVPMRGFWGGLGRWTVRHSRLAVASSLVLLALLALGNIGSQPSLNTLTSFRVTSDATRGYALLQQHFPAGTLAPTTVVLLLQGATPDAYQHLAQIDAITAALKQVPGVATIQGPTRPDGNVPSVDPVTLQANIAALPGSIRNALRDGKSLPACSNPPCVPLSSKEAITVGAYVASLQDVSADNTTVQLSLTLKDDPYSLTAINQIASLRNAVGQILAAHGLGSRASTRATFHLAGQSAFLADTLAYNQHDVFLIVPVVLILVFLVLALLLRSLIAPLYLLGAVTLNFLAAIGICGFVFQRIQGQDGFNYAIPLYTFIFLVALGADYTIFLMSRVREEVQQRGIEAGIPFAVSRTGGVITSAGLILAGTFLVLTTLPLTLLYQLGACVAVGILLDTFVVRGLLVPGLVVLLGRWNWWPGSIKADMKQNFDAPLSSASAMTTEQK